MMSQKNEAKIFNILLTKLLIRVERNNLSAKKTRREEVSIRKNFDFIFFCEVRSNTWIGICTSYNIN